MSKTRNQLGIFPKLLLVMVVVATLPLALIWYATAQSTSQLVTEQVDQRLSQTASALSSHIAGWVDMNVRMLRQNSATPDITSFSRAIRIPC